MKALPEAVQRAFPCAPDRLPERPWWRPSHSEERGVVYERRIAGVWAPLLVYTDPVRGRCRGVTPLPEGTLPLHDAMATIDADHPLPHPGYRAGQVWADDVGRSVVCASERGTFLSFAAAGPLSLDAAGYRYLMADPACPHLAPWSPATPKETK
jgi:hypothetical protein